MVEYKNNIKIVIADDDEPICNLLKDYLSSFEDVTIMGTALDGVKLIDLIRETKPDVVFLDIQMPGLDGLSVVHRLQREFPLLFIVFVTAHTQYAVDAFNLNATDFLVKPVNLERLTRALNKVRSHKNIVSAKHNNISLGSISGENIESNFLILKQGHGIAMVEKKIIIFAEKLGKKCIVHTREEQYETSTSLTNIEKLMQPPDFFRCHKSFIINVKMVKKILPFADRAYEVYFHNYPLKALMRREKFEEFCKLINSNSFNIL